MSSWSDIKLVSITKLVPSVPALSRGFGYILIFISVSLLIKINLVSTKPIFQSWIGKDNILKLVLIWNWSLSYHPFPLSEIS